MYREWWTRECAVREQGCNGKQHIDCTNMYLIKCY